MPQLASKEYDNVPVPRKVKISSKRQITIPVDIYERQGFAEYALLTETPDGLQIQPFNLADDDEELTLMLLRHLMDSGYEGEELLQKYKEIKPEFLSYQRAVDRSEADIAADRVANAEEVQQRLRAKYGL